jgi:hypothetical protein
MTRHKEIAVYTDLEKMCRRSKFANGYIPYLFWTSETYSLGKIYRELISWPGILQLPFTSDHGVVLNLKIGKIDLNTESMVHFTWNHQIIENNVDKCEKQLIHIECPWVTYRKKKNYKIKKNAEGTIAFVPHSLSNLKPSATMIEEYIQELEKLPEKFKPISLCLSAHDIRDNLHIKLKSQFPYKIVTVGDQNRRDYIDRWYDLISNFKFGVSNVFGTQIPLMIELGIPSSIIGERSNYTNSNFESDVLPYGTFDPLLTNYAVEVSQKFEGLHDRIQIEQLAVTSELLGIGVGCQDLTKFRRLFYKELTRIYYLRVRNLLKFNNLPRGGVDG